MKKQEENIDKIFTILHEKICEINIYYNIFKEFRDQLNIHQNIFKRSGEFYFFITYFMFLRTIVLTIGKLLEGKNELSLVSIIEYLKVNKKISEAVFTEMMQNVDEIKKSYKDYFILWRNKSIAHFDLEYSIGSKQIPKIEFINFSIISDINKLMNVINKILNKGFTDYEGTFTNDGFELLIKRLKFAEEYDKYEIYFDIPLQDLDIDFDITNFSINDIFNRINKFENLT